MTRGAPCSRNVYLSHQCDPLSIQGLEIGVPPRMPLLEFIENELATTTCELGAPRLPIMGDLMANVSWSRMSYRSVHQALGRGPAIAGVPRSQHINLALPGWDLSCRPPTRM
jgi:hypothetical protein